jgi:nucleoside-diphosphate-sugar epimerase
MKALVTGATGFVGGHLVEALLRGGHEVTALARSPAKAAALIRQGARVVQGDLHNHAALDQAVEGQDLIYHVAGMVAARNEAEFLQANREGTRNVVTAAERGRTTRVVLVSSLAAAGPAVKGTPLTGREPPRPVTAYGRSKLAAEQILTSSSLRWSIVRPPIVYGPRDREVLKVFRLVRLRVAPVFGDGAQELSAIHVADLANALLSVGTSPVTAGGVYVACHPEVFTSAELASAIAAAMGRSVTTIRIPGWAGRALLSVTERASRFAREPTVLTTDKANEFFQPAWTGDPESLTRDTGWQANYDLARGLADTYDWYRRAGWL